MIPTTHAFDYAFTRYLTHAILRYVVYGRCLYTVDFAPFYVYVYVVVCLRCCVAFVTLRCVCLLEHLVGYDLVYVGCALLRYVCFVYPLRCATFSYVYVWFVAFTLFPLRLRLVAHG